MPANSSPSPTSTALALATLAIDQGLTLKAQEAARSFGNDVVSIRPGARVPLYFYARSDIHVLVSRHADAQIIVEMCRHFRVPTILGSTTHGGAAAIRGLLHAGRQSHLAITPDGPRGPRRQVQQGIIYLAGQIGLPIVPVGFGLRRPWRTASWDRFALPRPWSRATCVTGQPIVVPAGAAKDKREHFRQLVEASMLDVTDLAEKWAQTGKWPTQIAE